jgi:sulfoxide reductase heme-binding subunit YedZ
LTVASGYIAVVLLALTLLTGPANLMLRRRTPVSTYFRRDIGLAATAVSLAHVVFGFLVGHADGVLGYFLEAGDRTKILTNSFGLANWAGLAATAIVVGLAAISSDAALRKLKAKRWKRLQRLNYLLFGLVIVHAVLYGALWRRTSPYTLLLVISTVIVLAGQAIGVRLWRRRRAKTALAAT